MRLEPAYFQCIPMDASQIVPSFVSTNLGWHGGFLLSRLSKNVCRTAQLVQLVPVVETHVFSMQASGLFLNWIIPFFCWANWVDLGKNGLSWCGLFPWLQRAYFQCIPMCNSGIVPSFVSTNLGWLYGCFKLSRFSKTVCRMPQLMPSSGLFLNCSLFLVERIKI